MVNLNTAVDQCLQNGTAVFTQRIPTEVEFRELCEPCQGTDVSDLAAADLEIDQLCKSCHDNDVGDLVVTEGEPRELCESYQNFNELDGDIVFLRPQNSSRQSEVLQLTPPVFPAFVVKLFTALVGMIRPPSKGNCVFVPGITRLGAAGHRLRQRCQQLLQPFSATCWPRPHQ